MIFIWHWWKKKSAWTKTDVWLNCSNSMRMQCCHGNYLCATDNDLNQQPVLDCPPSESAIVLSCTVRRIRPAAPLMVLWPLIVHTAVISHIVCFGMCKSLHYRQWFHAMSEVIFVVVGTPQRESIQSKCCPRAASKSQILGWLFLRCSWTGYMDIKGSTGDKR